MQSSETLSQRIGPTASLSLLEGISWIYKLPFAFVFGCVLGLSSPGFDLHYLAWFGLVPLLVLLRAASGKIDAATTGGAFGFGYYLVSLSWYLGLFPLNWLGLQDWLGIQAAAIVWLVESVHQALLFVAFSLMIYCLPMRGGALPHYKRPFFPYLISVPLLWIFFHWAVATSELFVGIPVNQLAYSQFKQLDLIQIARLGGSGLIDFLLVLANAALAEMLIEFTGLARKIEERVDQISPKAGTIVDVAAVSLLFLLAVSWGEGEAHKIALTTRPDNEDNYLRQTPTIPIAVVQGNVTIEEDRLKTTSAKEIADRYTKLDNNLGVPIIFLPEGLINSQQMSEGLLLSRLKWLAHKQQKEIITGSVETLKNGLVNAARLVSNYNEPNDLYVKRRLVPFGEFAPLGALGQDLSERIDQKLPFTRESFLASHSMQLIKSVWGKAGVSICVELVYPKLISEEVRHGANILVNISNLAWFHGSSLNKQVLAAAVLRAVENGRYLVLSTNTGISAVVDPSGTIKSMSYPNKRGVLLDTVQFLYGATPYSKMWWL